MSNRIPNNVPAYGNWVGILLGTLSLAGLYAISRYNFLLFHCLTEAFSIVIAIAVFAIFWNTRRFLDNGVYLVIGFGCLLAGALDLIYIFAYPGMSVFPGADGNLALQAKTVAQWYVSLSCVCAIPFLRRKINPNRALLVYVALLALALGAIFYWRIFPDCFVEGVGITPFARAGLVISCGGYLGTLFLLAGRRRLFDGYVFKLLVATLIAFLVEDFASLVATDINGVARAVAHLCQIVALYFVYKAFVEVGLTRPYDLLFKSQQQSAEALERQQQFLEAVLDNAQCGIIACDANGVLTVFNRTLRELHGPPQESIPAGQWAEHYALYHLDGKTRMGREELPLVRALQGERIHGVEMMVVPKAGPPRTVTAGGEPLRGKDGENRGAVVVLHDITERKRAEEDLKRANSLLNATLESTADGLLVVAPDGKVVGFNRRFLDLWRIPESLAAQRDDNALLQFVLEQLKAPDAFLAKVKDLYLSPEASSFDELQFRDGRVFERFSQPQRVDGRPVGRVWSFRDITEQKRVEEALTAAASDWSVTFDAMADGVSVHGPDYTISNVNQSLCHMLGRTREDLIGRKCYQIFHGADAPIAGCPIEKSRRTFRKEDTELFEPTLNRWLAASASPILDDARRLVRLVHTVRDVTDRRRAQEVLEKAHEEQLERHRAELTHVARLSIMGEMAASLAHELNQPLHAVNNYASGSLLRLLKTPHRDEEIVAALQQISEEANRAAEIVRRVRGFVQKREPQSSEVSVNSLVEEALLLSKAEFEQRHAKVALELSRNLPVVIGDQVQIEQVIMNLVRNGLEAMEETPEEDRLLGVKTMRHGDDMVQVEVRDRGTGIGREDLEKVFEPFFTTKPEGMGMGLAICRSIVQAHGGRLWVSVNEDLGCTFHFTLPVGKRS